MKHIGKALVLGLAACGARGELASPATISSGAAYVPGPSEVALARRFEGSACAGALAPMVHFARGSDAMLAGEPDRLASWAECLNRPELAHTTVVLAGADEPDGPRGLYLERTERLRASLVAQGVDPARIVAAAPLVSPVGPTAGTGAVRFALTWSDSVRALAGPDGAPAAPGGSRSLP